MTTLFAYIDPFTGTLLLQLLAGAFLAAMVFFKKAKAFVLGLFGFGVVVDLESKSESADVPTIKLDEPGKEEKKAA